MPRRRLSEYRTKMIISEALGMNYTGWPIDLSRSLQDQLRDIDGKSDSFCVKVDQGIKGRFKKGLVRLDISFLEIEKQIILLHEKGYSRFIVEPMMAHDQKDELYLSFTLTRRGLSASFTNHGGVDVESHKDDIDSQIIGDPADFQRLSESTGLSEKTLSDIVSSLKAHHISFLEINPYVVDTNSIKFLDMAAEVDDAGTFFSGAWTDDDIVSTSRQNNAEETIAALNRKSPASFMLNVLNPEGGIFLLLSGGGASVTIADEIYAAGMGQYIANYGEYSGNPNSEETYLYTRELIGLLVASKAPRKVLIIGGAVANFTDIASTFDGVIRAIRENAMMLKSQRVKVFVRRGGPRQEVGLQAMKDALHEMGIVGAVHGPEIALVDAVHEAVEVVRQ